MHTGLLADYFASQGHQVTWWTGDVEHFGRTPRNFGSVLKPVAPGYDIHYLAARGYRKSMSLARLQYDRAVARRFTQMAPALPRPDVILAAMPSVDLARASVQFGRKHKIPVIVHIRDLHPDIFFDLLPRMFRPALYLATRPMAYRVRELCRGASAIWGNGQHFVAWGCKAAGRTPTHRDRTFPIVYRPPNVPAAELRATLAGWQARGLFQQDKLNLVFLGSLSKSFNFTPVFEAAQLLAKENSPYRFYFFGRGVQEVRIAEHCAACPNSHSMGWAGPTALQAAMSCAHLGLAPYIPSLNYIGNMPNKPAEYLSMGLGIGLGLKSGELADLLTGTGAGFCYETGEELAGHLRGLAADRAKLTRMRDAARDLFARNFHFETQAHKMLTALQEHVAPKVG